MFTNKVALVTGAGRGIGKAIAIKLAGLGITVAGIDYSEEYVRNISLFLKESNLSGQGFFMDVTKQESVDVGLSKIIETYGAPSILINNAGITRDNLMLNMSQDDWDQLIATNLTSVFRLCQPCIRNMIKDRWGRIVNISSIAGCIGSPGQTNYSASKAGLIAMSRSLAIEIATHNITVNCIAPGCIETDMAHRLTDAQKEALLAMVPMKRAGSPQDIANACAFLVSDDASYITGATIHVNGGMFMN